MGERDLFKQFYEIMKNSIRHFPWIKEKNLTLIEVSSIQLDLIEYKPGTNEKLILCSFIRKPIPNLSLTESKHLNIQMDINSQIKDDPNYQATRVFLEMIADILNLNTAPFLKLK